MKTNKNLKRAIVLVLVIIVILAIWKIAYNVGKSSSVLPVVVDNWGKPVQKNGCVVGGCFGQVCAEKNSSSLVSDKCNLALPAPSVACYKNATCERQSNNQCGWTQTSELKSCLSYIEGGFD